MHQLLVSHGTRVTLTIFQALLAGPGTELAAQQAHPYQLLLALFEQCAGKALQVRFFAG